mgnify:CR=1 FL=1
MTPAPCSCATFRNKSITCRPRWLSSAAVGSSARMRLGRFASARATATRCCWPPEGEQGERLKRVGVGRGKGDKADSAHVDFGSKGIGMLKTCTRPALRAIDVRHHESSETAPRRSLRCVGRGVQVRVDTTAPFWVRAQSDLPTASSPWRRALRPCDATSARDELCGYLRISAIVYAQSYSGVRANSFIPPSQPVTLLVVRRLYRPHHAAAPA